MDKMLSAFWRRRSLRFWLVTGMAMSLLPIFVSATAGYVLHHRTIIQPLVEVASKQRGILQPLKDINLHLWDVSTSVIDFAVDGDTRRKAAYKDDADRIESAFEGLSGGMREYGLEIPHVAEARNAWAELAAISNSILSGHKLGGGDAVLDARIEKFETLIEDLGVHLEMAHDAVRVKNEQTHDLALINLKRSERLALVGFAVSIFGAVLGIALISRSLVNSMDRLVVGAMRLASGDREHSINVQIPRELTVVADAFNLMTRRIREQEDALARAAKTDGLTGLYNRREFEYMLAYEIRRAQRYGGYVSVILADIDHFKRFNDTYGHQAGDEALRTVARTLKEGMRDVDRVCRYGGEEIVIVLPDCDANGAQQAAERARAAVETSVIELDLERSAGVTISAGVATFPGNGNTPETLVKSADTALYKSKELGRNRVTAAV